MKEDWLDQQNWASLARVLASSMEVALTLVMSPHVYSSYVSLSLLSDCVRVCVCMCVCVCVYVRVCACVTTSNLYRGGYTWLLAMQLLMWAAASCSVGGSCVLHTGQVTAVGGEWEEQG